MRAEKDNNLYERSLRVATFGGLIGGVFTALVAGPGLGARYTIFLAWALVNLKIWRHFLAEVLGPRRFLPLFLFSTLKIFWIVILVVLASFAGLGEKIENFLAFLLGFNTPFLVMFLKALGSTVSRSAKPSESRTINRPPDAAARRSVVEE